MVGVPVTRMTGEEKRTPRKREYGPMNEEKTLDV